jgi:hypothetical protein
MKAMFEHVVDFLLLLSPKGFFYSKYPQWLIIFASTL